MPTILAVILYYAILAVILHTHTHNETYRLLDSCKTCILVYLSVIMDTIPCLLAIHTHSHRNLHVVLMAVEQEFWFISL